MMTKRLTRDIICIERGEGFPAMGDFPKGITHDDLEHNTV